MDMQIRNTSLKLKELAKAVKEFKSDKAPGNNGLSTNFYKLSGPILNSFCLTIFSILLITIYYQMINGGEYLTSLQNQAKDPSFF